jgi:hypothetical protein
MTVVISLGATFLFYSMLRVGAVTVVTSLFYCIPPMTIVLD